MSQSIAYRGRLPGLRCDPALPLAVDDAIRLDVAAFVGFAERGPVDDPQPVEDPAQYEAVFGGDLPLAIDDQGVPVYAALPSAVRSYFDNGGRRAYVVRVVGDAPDPLAVPLRVISRRPLGGDTTVTGLAVGRSVLAPMMLVAASPGGWSVRLSVDIDVVDTVLTLQTADDGTVDLTPASRRVIEEGDALLVRRGEQWLRLAVPAEGLPVAPLGGWAAGDVARVLRADLTVREVMDGVATAVERFTALRFGPASAGARVHTRSWLDVLQPAAGGFRRDRSMYLRAPLADASDDPLASSSLVAMLGPQATEVDPEPGRPVPEAFSRAALEADGLVEYDPVRLFLDPSLTGHTIPGLRLALEVLGLDDVPRARGLHSLALVPEVAILAVPDLYQRPWTEQAVLVDPTGPEPPSAIEPLPPTGFHRCDPVAAPPAEPPPIVSPLPARLRMVADPPSAYSPAGLVTVAGAIADLCAARADLVGVLGLPRHAGRSDAAHVSETLAARPEAGTDALSYVGLWHPWGAIVEDRSASLSPLRPLPSDGAVCGTISAGELTRGLWIEPAGRPLAGFVAADPFDDLTELALFDRGLNVVHRRPSGFVATSAHSLSADHTLLQLTVRRLLIWLRKLALREGRKFVFESDNERFRAQVSTVFNRSLEQLRQVGALVAFEVDVEELADRPEALEGQVRIALKVAPTSPIEFITVSLLRSGEGILSVTGG